MSVVAPFADPRQIADALNDFASRFSGGVVELGSGTATVFQDPRVGPRSLLFITTQSASTVLDGATAGDGTFTIEHASSQAGHIVGYFSFSV